MQCSHHLWKHWCRPSTPITVTMLHSKKMLTDILPKLRRKKVSTWPLNSPDPNRIEHPLDWSTETQPLIQQDSKDLLATPWYRTPQDTPEVLRPCLSAFELRTITGPPMLHCFVNRISVLFSSAVLLLLWLISVTSTWCGNNRKFTVSHPVFYSEVFTTCVDISDLKQIMKLVGLVMLLYQAELYCSAWGYTEISSASDFDIKIYY